MLSIARGACGVPAAARWNPDPATRRVIQGTVFSRERLVKRSRAILEKLSALALGLLLLLLLLEATLWVVGGAHQPLRVDSASLRGALTGGADAVVLCVGDSMTYGIGATAGGDYPAQLEQQLSEQLGLDVAVVNAGMAGANTTMMLQALPQYLGVVQPDLVILLAGTANLSNFYGYHRFLEGDSWRVRLREALFRVRVLRLAATVRAELRRRRGGIDPGILHGTTAAVVAYQRWWDRTAGDRGVGPPPAEFVEGSALLRLGAFDQALARYRAGARARPELSCHHWGMGMAAWGLRDRVQAEAHLQRAVELEPGDPNAYAALGELSLQPDLGAAERWFTRGVQADRSFSGNHWGLAMVGSREHSPRRVVAALTDCIEADPDDARCYAEFRQLSSAPAVFQEALGLLEGQAAGNSLARGTARALRQEQLGAATDAWVASDLEALVALSQQHGARVLVHGYPAPNDPSLPLLRLAQQLELPYVEHAALFEAQGSGEPLLLPDGHCTDAGYRLMAENLARAILQHELLPSSNEAVP